ncbi:MAG: nitronate monooxygenase family protein [Bacillota bacterium]|nr:nitronate monooxygenase family protein [Bacillota bacterium]
MLIPELYIGPYTAKYPVVQGGMGVGISLSQLAGAVAKAGGVGVISGVEPGYSWPTYDDDKQKANREAMVWHLQEARRIAPEGVIGVNIMVALNNYEEMVQAAIEGGADVIFSGAGLPLALPALVAGTRVAIAPIVSSAKAAVIMVKQWRSKYNRLPDAIVVEGPLAGGHLGFSYEQLHDTTGQFSLDTIVVGVIEALKQLLGEGSKSIAIIAGGGVFTGSDIAKMLRLGVNGVQMATRFVATVECDAHEAFKQAYVKATPEDVVIIKSPVGMPGRALGNAFLDEAKAGNKQPDWCRVNCLKPCNPSEAPYCIADALVNAAQGQFAEGFAFCGSEVHRIDKITTVPELMEELMSELAEQ